MYAELIIFILIVFVADLALLWLVLYLFKRGGLR